jgi:hypothetical protein
MSVKRKFGDISYPQPGVLKKWGVGGMESWISKTVKMFS